MAPMAVMLASVVGVWPFEKLGGEGVAEAAG